MSAGRPEAVQLGVINVAADNEGIPIGLIGIMRKNGQTHAQAWYDELGLMNIALIHGTKTVYNIYTVGVDSQLEDLTVGSGLGLVCLLARYFSTPRRLGAVSPVVPWP